MPDTTDTITASFVNTTGGGSTQINSITSLTLDSDFFTPADGFTMTIEDDRAINLLSAINVGSKIQIFVNQSCNLIGYVDKIALGYSRSGGTHLTISGRDVLGKMCDATVLPNVTGSPDNNYSFTSTTTLSTIMETLFQSFILGTINIDDSSDLTAATGFAVGIKVKGKRII